MQKETLSRKLRVHIHPIEIQSMIHQNRYF